MLQCADIHPRILERMCVAFSEIANKEGGSAALIRSRNLWGAQMMKYLNTKDIEHKKELAQNER